MKTKKHLDWETLIEFNEGILSEMEAEKVREHLEGGCLKCQKLLQDIKSLSNGKPIGEIGHLPPTPPELLEKAITIFREHYSGRSEPYAESPLFRAQVQNIPNVNLKQSFFVKFSRKLVNILINPEKELLGINRSGSLDRTLDRLHRGLRFIDKIEKFNPPHSVKTGIEFVKMEILMEIGDILDVIERPKEAIASRTSALFIARSLRNEPIECRILREIGVSYFKLSEYSLALKNFKRSYAIAERLGLTSEIYPNIRNIGCVMSRIGEYKEAIKFFEQSLEFAQAESDMENLIKDLHNLSISYRKAGEYEKALYYCEKALEMETNMGDKMAQALTLVSMSNILSDLGFHSQAIQKCQIALNYFERENFTREAAMCLFNIGNSLNELKRYSEALDYFKRSLEMKRACHDQAGIIYNLIEMGRAYRELGELELALNTHKNALSMANRIGAEAITAEIKNQLAQDYFRMQNISEAINLGTESLSLAETINDDLLLMRTYFQLARFYCAKNEYKDLRAIYNKARLTLSKIISKIENITSKENFLAKNHGIDLFKFDYQDFIEGLKTEI